MTDEVWSVSSRKVFPLTKVATLLTWGSHLYWACTLKLSLHQVEAWKKQNCQNVPPAGTQCGQMGANWCGSSKPGLRSLCRRHLRRCKTSMDLLPLHSCFIVLTRYKQHSTFCLLASYDSGDFSAFLPRAQGLLSDLFTDKIRSLYPRKHLFHKMLKRAALYFYHQPLLI